ncbi:DNA polymerase beta domain protein region [Geobacter metallireducens RCH3]|nr:MULTISPECIES: nucleotidyltransferase domain-containing protein [Geobacter]EHP83996.1 DNA polymerase beta domain protein region [Geobacter metallireducens RCH3]MBT1075498.1 nucleotidyltransferase domain-containing protein [Geobacter grbiciae]
MRPTKEELLAFLQSKKTDFRQEFTIQKLGVFGSFARGTATDESDIDLVVELEKPDLYNLIGIKQAVEEEFGGKVDVVRLRPHMNSMLKKRIEQDAIYV